MSLIQLLNDSCNVGMNEFRPSKIKNQHGGRTELVTMALPPFTGGKKALRSHCVEIKDTFYYHGINLSQSVSINKTIFPLAFSDFRKNKTFM